MAHPSAVERRLSRDRILTEATIYWVTQSIATSFRPYYEAPDIATPIPPVEVPAAVFIQTHEHDYPESLAREFYRDLRVLDRLPEGEHVTAAEIPEELADRVRSFAREIGALPEHRKPSDEVGPAGIEPTTSTVESYQSDADGHIAEVIDIFGARAS